MKSKKQKQEAMEDLVILLVAGLIICLIVAACSISAMEKAAQPLTLKEQAAMVQARWEANARARVEVGNEKR